MTACDWCEREFPEKPGKLFCCGAHRQAFHAACRAYTHDMLAKGYTTKEALRRLYSPCTASGAHTEGPVDMRGLLTQQGER